MTEHTFVRVKQDEELPWLPNSTQIWWDRTLRLWTLQTIDADGRETNDTEYAVNKGDLAHIIKGRFGI